MAVYIALLRGINVGGKHVVKMAELKRLFEELGYKRVETYIQSGNVLFESDEEEAELRRKLERGFESAFGFFSSIILRTSAEWKAIIAGCPFTEQEIAEAEASSDVECQYAAMLPEPPGSDDIARLETHRSENETYRIAGRDVYLLFRNNGIRNSKLANQLQKLSVPATVRNWKTMTKLAALAEALER